MKYKPDSTDWAILDLLVKEHISNNEVSRRLGLSEGTVRRRIKLLRKAGIMHTRALLDPNKLKNKQLVIILANVTEAHNLSKIAEEVNTLENVLSVSLISGQHDLMIEVLVNSNRGLVDFLAGELASIKGIARTETSLVLKSHGKYI
jgi:Lrp/AsnC family transcriptional regulator for asnA, asnC and gidA